GAAECVCPRAVPAPTFCSLRGGPEAETGSAASPLPFPDDEPTPYTDARAVWKTINGNRCEVVNADDMRDIERALSALYCVAEPLLVPHHPAILRAMPIVLAIPKGR